MFGAFGQKLAIEVRRCRYRWNWKTTSPNPEIPTPETAPVSWYEVVSGADLAQGDLLTQVDVSLATYPPEVGHEDDVFSFDVFQSDVIVLTQTCDLERDQPTSILVAQYDSWSTLKADQNLNSGDRKRIRRQQMHYYQLLPDRELEPTIEWSVVDFRLLSLVPKQYLIERAVDQGERLRLLPPYREGVAQAFAHYIMRVAYDDDLNRFDDLPGG
jgi:hypothetical protein